MSSTLDDLDRSVIAAPADRTVRLVYADALEEYGDSVRAEFIRAQIACESLPEGPDRTSLESRCGELFEEHWLAWWHPVAEAAGLPYPYEPGRHFRQRVSRAVGRRTRPANWPYLPSTAEREVHLPEYGLNFSFRGGFPESVRFLAFETPEGGPVLVHRWGDAMPLVRLSFGMYLGAAEWGQVHGPHLSRLANLSLARLLPQTAEEIARSEYLSELQSLTANPLGSDAGIITSLVASPVWSGLRTLRLAGRTSPDGIRALARSCDLDQLEELELALGHPGVLGSPMDEIVTSVFRLIVRAASLPTAEAPRWAEFGPALEALAASTWVRRLRVLRINSGHTGGLLDLLGERLPGGTETVADRIPDRAVLALADAVATDKLERLALPGAIVGASVREELTTRLTGRVVFL